MPKAKSFTSSQTTVVVIPDTQIRPGAPIAHLRWIGQYTVDTFKGRDNVSVVHLGDHWDFPSLSSYDKKGGRKMEGRRVLADIEAGNEAFDVLNKPFDTYNRRRRAQHLTVWEPPKHLLRGNHEDRLSRAIEDNPQMEGILSFDLLQSPGWKVHDFLNVLEIAGTRFSHYFVNNTNGKPVGGMIETRIKSIGCSFVQGHQQGLRTGMLETVAGRRRGVVAGSCYLTAEAYRGPQAQGEWRGILILNAMQDGDFDVEEVSLNQLCLRYEGMPLDQFLKENFGGWAQ